MRRYLLFGIFILFFLTSANAVRQERNMNQMVISMHHELVYNWRQLQKNRKQEALKLHQVDSLIHSLSEKSDECAMMVYSTDDNAFLDMAYASQSAVSEFEEFSDETSEYLGMLRYYRNTVARQDSLMAVVKSVDQRLLGKREKKLLHEAIDTLDSSRAYNVGVLRHLKALYPEYIKAYTTLKNASEQGKQKFDIIRGKVLYNFDNNIFHILSDWSGYVKRRTESIDAHWSVDDNLSGKGENVSLVIDLNNLSEISAWGFMRVATMFVVIIVILFISIGVGIGACILTAILRKICRMKFWETHGWEKANDRLDKWLHLFNKKQIFFLVTVLVNVLYWTKKMLFMGSAMAQLHSLLWEIYYVMVLIAIATFCLVLRYRGRHLGRHLAVCFPTILSLLYAMYCHIMMYPDASVILEVTVSSVVIYILQLIFFIRFNKQLDKTMRIVSHLCLGFSCVAMVIALAGLQFLSNMLTIFWSNLLVVIILLTTVKFYVDRVAEKYQLLDQTIGRNWWLLLVDKVLYPMAWIYAVLVAANLSCQVYSLNEFLNTLLATNFNTPLGNLTLNINLIIFICWNWFVAVYLSSLAGKVKALRSQISLCNVLRVFIWGLAVINIMIKMGFSMEWIGISFAGLSTGVGFASREIIENVIYGLALRSGFMKKDDWVVSDGIRGQVKSIGVLSTRLDSVEGTVLNIANERLFHRDFENATLNHGYELLHTPFSVDYGEDIDKVRKVLIEGYQKFDCYDKERPITVFTKKLDDSWVDLDFRVWVPAEQYIRLTAFNVEYVYNTLKENGINFPYPVLTVENRK